MPPKNAGIVWIGVRERGLAGGGRKNGGWRSVCSQFFILLFFLFFPFLTSPTHFRSVSANFALSGCRMITQEAHCVAHERLACIDRGEEEHVGWAI